MSKKKYTEYWLINGYIPIISNMTESEIKYSYYNYYNIYVISIKNITENEFDYYCEEYKKMCKKTFGRNHYF